MGGEENGMDMGESLMGKLYEQDVFRLGQFTLKSGQLSPIYIDLRTLISSPPILKLASNSLMDLLRRNADIQYDYILGVPYAALPLSTLLSVDVCMPMLLRRKEAKTYGTKKLIEGVFEKGKKCLIVEDVVTSGSSILETVEVLKKEGLEVTDALVVLDRQQGGTELLAKHGIRLFSVMCMDGILDHLVSRGVLDVNGKTEMVNQLQSAAMAVKEQKRDWTWTTRMEQCSNEAGRRLMQLVLHKKSNLCVAADYSSQKQILQLAESVGSEICLFKIHVDIIADFDDAFWKKLTDIAQIENFMIMEDRKLGDTGATVAAQVTGGVHGIAAGAHLVTAHALPGPSVLQGLKTAIDNSDTTLKGCLLIGELSTEGTLTSIPGYTSGFLR